MPEWIISAAVVALTIAFLGATFKFAYWRGEVDTDRKTFKKFMGEIREDMGEIRNKFEKILLRLPPTPVAGSSPLRLTDLGVEIADDLKAYEWASRLTPSLRGEVRDMLPYEVDEFCEKFVERHISRRTSGEASVSPPEHLNEYRAMATKVAICAYERGLDRAAVRKVLRVVLRDELLNPKP